MDDWSCPYMDMYVDAWMDGGWVKIKVEYK